MFDFHIFCAKEEKKLVTKKIQKIPVPVIAKKFIFFNNGFFKIKFPCGCLVRIKNSFYAKEYWHRLIWKSVVQIKYGHTNAICKEER